MTAGDARGMVRYFYDYRVPAGDASQLVGAPSQGTPMAAPRYPGNVQLDRGRRGRRGIRGALLDYVPIYASPIGAAFASWVTC